MCMKFLEIKKKKKRKNNITVKLSLLSLSKKFLVLVQKKKNKKNYRTGKVNVTNPAEKETELGGRRAKS